MNSWAKEEDNLRFGESIIGILKSETPLKDSSEMWSKMKL